MTGLLKALPLLAFVVVAYFVTVIAGTDALNKNVLSGTAPSGAPWTLRTADLILGLGLFVLFFEIVKSTRSTVSSIVDQILSMLLFAACIVLFLVVRSAGTGTFLLLTTMSFVDVLSAFIITVSVSRRDVTIERTY